MFLETHYNVNTDMELLFGLFEQLEQNSLTKYEDIMAKLKELKINSFTDLMNFVSGSDCPNELALVIEELLDRLRLTEPKRKAIFTSSKEVGNFLSAKLTGHKQEELWIFYIDNNNRIIAEKKISQGTLDRSIVHPRDVFRWAVVFNAASLIAVHNHPSGNLLPSNSDLKITRKLQEAAEMMKIKFLDHFIVGKGHYLSMRENELF